MRKRAFSIIAICAVLLAAIGVGIPLSVKKVRKEKGFDAAVNPYYEGKNEAFVQENPTKVGVDVAFIGDSLTDGYDVAGYYPEFSVANRGIGGDTTYGVEQRLQTSLFDIQPRAVVMMIGTNNLDTMFENYRDILRALHKNLPDTEIVILSVPPTSGPFFADRNEQIVKNNKKLKALVARFGYTYVDVHTPLLDENGELRAAYTLEGLHFTAEGYEVITATVKPVLLELLSK